MTQHGLRSVTLLLSSLALHSPWAQAQTPTLTGDTRLACEAILCLSVVAAPSACRPALQRYFGIRPRKLSDLVRQRLQFLQLCPASSQTPAMRALVSAMSHGAGRCDAASLNAVLITEGLDGRRTVSDQLPDYCRVYMANPMLQLPIPVYIGTPDEGGFWAPAEESTAALARYRNSISSRDAHRLESPEDTAPGR